MLFRQAAAVLRPMPEVPSAARLRVGAAWSKIDPKLRDWLGENRAALALFRQGAERPDGIVNPGIESGSRIGDVNPGSFVLLAVLEGSRLEEKGEMEGAWNWYRSVLRMRALVMRRGSVFQRSIWAGSVRSYTPASNHGPPTPRPMPCSSAAPWPMLLPANQSPNGTQTH